ncbi:hypothetical protein ODJ79_37175 [Actinoplanes sp. KI2]|uniref:hypothetical protein n=1 Tax=Actinoplanes sp. KI2 TaxID=2983315 RepID=UPI0021D5ED70|nr:hypothetical protein [Actinoplanes sp. KI2]MCU7729381.1 hypothetical protein [Actinoplanes sp. KI2]
MSYDLYFWPSGTGHDPGRLADRLAEERAEALVPDDRVVAFRAELLRRWPELADMISPWHADLGRRQPWGRTDLADRFVGLTLPFHWKAVDALPALAGLHGLDCYDPQAERLVSPRPGSDAATAAADRRGDVPSVAGWVFEDHLVELFRKISAYIGYPYDGLDEAALIGALDDTDDESTDAWFEYPLAGAPPLNVRLARSPGSAVVSVRVEGTMDPVLAARVETVLDML